jgi:hypothetical protein
LLTSSLNRASGDYDESTVTHMRIQQNNNDDDDDNNNNNNNNNNFALIIILSTVNAELFVA